jgi:ABC-type glycerol-3-phosphate transport system permease component
MAKVSDLPSVTLAPDDHLQNDELLVSGDRNFAVHGEIMMLVLLLLFTSFFLFILYLVCAKRLKDASKVTQSELISPRNFTISKFKGQIRSEGHLMHQSMESNTTQQPA